jgi:hypothetical protein
MSTTNPKEPKLPSEALGVDPTTSTAPTAGPPLDAYYDAARKEYLMKNSGGRWLSHGESGFRRLLKSKGYSCALSKQERDAGESVSEVEKEMLRIQDTRDVNYCGPLAGRDSGFYDENGARFLVTESPRLISPTPGDWPVIRAVLTGLVAHRAELHGAMQLKLLLGWLASAVQSLYQKSRRPGQALVLAGPVGCGKSVVQNKIVTPLLGGRLAKCAPYMQGKTPFNGELFAAEHLMLEDESSDTCIKSRLALASNIKQVCVNDVQPCHGKHRPMINLKPFWRLTISLNDEPERLLIIPPLASDIADKLIILRCAPVAWPMPTGNNAEWSRFVTAMENEMPAFLHFLLHYTVEPSLHSDRYGVTAWHHPDLAKAIEEMSPEAHLALIIVRWLEPRTHWQGTADGLRTELLNYTGTERDARELLRWQNACGTYLARLTKNQRPPLDVRQHRSADKREWIITLPQK